MNTLTSDNPAQLARWADVDKTAQIWITQWTAKGIQLRQDVAAGKATEAQALAYEASGGGKQYMDAVRAELAAGQQTEEGLLVTRTATANSAILLGYNVILFGTLLAVIVGLGIAFFLARSISNGAKLMVEAATQISEVDLVALEAATAARGRR